MCFSKDDKDFDETLRGNEIEKYELDLKLFGEGYHWRIQQDKQLVQHLHGYVVVDKCTELVPPNQLARILRGTLAEMRAAIFDDVKGKFATKSYLSVLFSVEHDKCEAPQTGDCTRLRVRIIGSERGRRDFGQYPIWKTYKAIIAGDKKEEERAYLDFQYIE